MHRQDLARKALVARAALIDLAATAAKVPKLRLNLLRSIQLLEELAIRARAGIEKLDAFDGGEMLSNAMPAGLQVPAGVLAAPDKQVTPEALVAHEILVRKDLAATNGAKGGGMRTALQLAAFAKALVERAKNVAERKAAKVAAGVVALPARRQNKTVSPASGHARVAEVEGESGPMTASSTDADLGCLPGLK